ncbi:MAG: hypothetical protein A2921_00850 [Candidatus Magasanikbacteria bacterium RIFCSPLOWO2_01_FULL_43_20b]|uniref:Uncharacterized protein n=1 Tax=Candidatus Magasanikbacteria bacterium RIFCSPLOWO2_12_FULL_43_12 TaxID=1798692 RepID=A0A1F6MW19_9BACT|nr:MAG: hypothetical protein A3I93_00570 [Candidatus Magasanikbacteria bacterium RIFCSPLOWO2_02_FULL_43_22]OGH72827.1 MAG: hypothetical protein A2921_00850 [Candidatus Magasanikbacteria bacterium RIFCSPLOWO2_01_FULL_43_20b]OGH75623.1 MAG: hypothetical protein A3G00_03965 [Candidatus Magasanikbacteria bacterium RIFCSPLOWO2_12_FULL_43_12]
MYWLTKITKHKVLLTVLASIVFGLILLPSAPATVFAKTCATDADCGDGYSCTNEACVYVGKEEGDFIVGLDYVKDTGLGKQDVRTTISNIIRVALGLLGIVAVVIMLVGGFEWMTAGGDDEKVGTAKKRIFAGILGLAIILSAYAIARFVLEQLYTATTGGDYSTQETLD